MDYLTAKADYDRHTLLRAIVSTRGMLNQIRNRREAHRTMIEALNTLENAVKATGTPEDYRYQYITMYSHLIVLTNLIAREFGAEGKEVMK